jgi:hypothetical protein
VANKIDWAELEGEIVCIGWTNFRGYYRVVRNEDIWTEGMWEDIEFVLCGDEFIERLGLRCISTITNTEYIEKNGIEFRITTEDEINLISLK